MAKSIKAKIVHIALLFIVMAGVYLLGLIGLNQLILADTLFLKMLDAVTTFLWLAFTVFLVGSAYAYWWDTSTHSKSEMKDAFKAGALLEAMYQSRYKIDKDDRNNPGLGYDDFESYYEQNQ